MKTNLSLRWKFSTRKGERKRVRPQAETKLVRYTDLRENYIDLNLRSNLTISSNKLADECNLACLDAYGGVSSFSVQIHKTTHNNYITSTDYVFKVAVLWKRWYVPKFVNLFEFDTHRARIYLFMLERGNGGWPTPLPVVHTIMDVIVKLLNSWVKDTQQWKSSHFIL